MQTSLQPYKSEEDFWQMRNFLRQVFELNGRREHSWHVARLDYWRWHFIENVKACPPVELSTALWKDRAGQMAAILHQAGWGSVFMHIHPAHQSPAMLQEMIGYAEQNFTVTNGQGNPCLYLPVYQGDNLRREIIQSRGYQLRTWPVKHFRRSLENPLPELIHPPEFIIRSMERDDLPARSWASWLSFHPDEPDENYDGDWTWYQNIQTGPLYRRDLDIVAETRSGEIAAFCTIYYDDATRSAVCVLVGTVPQYQKRGLGKAVIFEGVRRLKKMGGTLVFANATDRAAEGLYSSVFGTYDLSYTWYKEW